MSFPRSNAPGSPRKRGRPGLWWHGTPLYAGSGRVCVCACVYALKVARVCRLAGGACSYAWADGLRVWVCICARRWSMCMWCDCVAMYSICMCGMVAFACVLWGVCGYVLPLCACVQCVRVYVCGHGVGGGWGGWWAWCGNESENESELARKTNQKPIRKWSKKPGFLRC